MPVSMWYVRSFQFSSVWVNVRGEGRRGEKGGRGGEEEEEEKGEGRRGRGEGEEGGQKRGVWKVKFNGGSCMAISRVMFQLTQTSC